MTMRRRPVATDTRTRATPASIVEDAKRVMLDVDEEGVSIVAGNNKEQTLL
jgi:ATP-dependent Clp protease adapter protein ClpS